jgi:hypothetical protein
MLARLTFSLAKSMKEVPKPPLNNYEKKIIAQPNSDDYGNAFAISSAYKLREEKEIIKKFNS